MIRSLRFLNLILAVWLVVAPWALKGASSAAWWSDTMAAVAIVILTLPRGPVREHYGGWDAYVR